MFNIGGVFASFQENNVTSVVSARISCREAGIILVVFLRQSAIFPYLLLTFGPGYDIMVSWKKCGKTQ